MLGTAVVRELPLLLEGLAFGAPLLVSLPPVSAVAAFGNARAFNSDTFTHVGGPENQTNQKEPYNETT